MRAIEYFYISDSKGFQGLRHDWNRLATQTDSGSVFLRHEWFDAAWGWLKGTSDLCIVCINRDGILIGICPLMLRRSRRSGVPVTMLEFMSVPDTQECDVLADPRDIADVAIGLVDCLYSGEISWDVMHLEKLRAESPSIDAIRSAATRHGSSVRLLESGTNPSIDLTDSWTSYYGRRSRRLKKGNNLIANRLKRKGSLVEIKCYDCDTAQDFELQSLMGVVVGLSASSWKASTGLTLDNPGPNAFIARLSEHAARKSWLLVWILTIDGEPAAMEYQLQYNGVVSGLRADYDPRYTESSPGTLLNWRIIEQLFDRDASRYSLGPGSNTYKMRWAEEQEQLKSLFGYGSSIRGRTVRAVDEHIRPLASFIKKRLKREASSDT